MDPPPEFVEQNASRHVCGIPDAFYTDHGSDLICTHMEQVGIDLKMALVFCFPEEPRGRGRTESFFNMLKC